MKKKNRLAKETSPYLLQHQYNPVDWFSWGDEAFELARSTDRPIMLSVGYSACHWCHVMERESFENEEIAAIMNRLFVNIKVDREERPDVDSIYMTAVQSMTGHGGWPMTVFMTPDGKPFFGGTYFPNEDRGGLPAFPRVLEAVSEAYHDPERKEQLLSTSSNVISRIQSLAAVRQSQEPISHDVVDAAATAFQREFDPEHGGMGIQPKFPQPMDYELLLRHWTRTGDEASLNMVITTLRKMARGGIYDQVGGGFARYSVDTYWLVPHFEKMLYDNAQLASLYLHAWQATGEPLFKQIVEETLTYVEREMTHEDGGFYSAQDADSEGEEGKFYVWLAQEIDEILGPELGKTTRAYWNVTRDGNFEGKNILNVPKDPAEVAAELELTEGKLRAQIDEARTKLYNSRSERVWPGLDNKVLTSWNSLMMKAFAECGAALDRQDWIDAAVKNADFILGTMRVEGRLMRTWSQTESGSGKSHLKAYLEDYAMLVDGLLTLYEATFDPRWFEEATRTADEMIELFWSYDEAVFFDTGSDHEELLVRPRDIFDNAIPSGGSTAAFALLRLAIFTGEPAYHRTATASLRAVRDMAVSAPQGTAHWINAIDVYSTTAQEIVIVGSPTDPTTQQMIKTARRGFNPNRVIASAVDSSAIESPLFEDRPQVGGKPTAFVCENYACKLPVTSPDELAKQLV